MQAARVQSSDARRRLAVSLLGVAVLVGCSSQPEPVAEMASARTAVRAVEGTDAEKLSPVLLDRAKTKLRRAEAAIEDKDYAEARRMADEALADAELARASADAQIATRNAEELEESIRVLRSEIDRARSTN